MLEASTYGLSEEVVYSIYSIEGIFWPWQCRVTVSDEPAY